MLTSMIHGRSCEASLRTKTRAERPKTGDLPRPIHFDFPLSHRAAGWTRRYRAGTSGTVSRTGTSSGCCTAATNAGPPVQSSQTVDHVWPSSDPSIGHAPIELAGNAIRSANPIVRTTRGVPRSISSVSTGAARTIAGQGSPTGATRAAGCAGSTNSAPPLELPCGWIPGTPSTSRRKWPPWSKLPFTLITSGRPRASSVNTLGSRRRSA